MSFLRYIKKFSNIKDMSEERRNEYSRPRPYLAVDCVAIGYTPTSKKESLGCLRVFLKYRKGERKWSLPGRFVRSAERRVGNVIRDEKQYEEMNEYGPEAETIPQCFRLALFSKSDETWDEDGGIAKTYFSDYFKPVCKDPEKCVCFSCKECEHRDRCNPPEFQDGEFVMQLPIRSRVDRDNARVKSLIDENGKEVIEHPNYRVISLPILTMVERDKLWEFSRKTGLEHWVPLDWVIEDNPEVLGALKSPKDEGDSALRKYPREPELVGRFGLAFDHAEIVASAIRALRNVIRSQPIGRELLPEKFKLSDLNRIYDEIVGYRIEPSNFRKSMMERGKPRDGKKGDGKSNDSEDKSYVEKNLVVATSEMDSDTTRRSATLVTFNKKVYQEYLEHLDFNFTL